MELRHLESVNESFKTPFFTIESRKFEGVDEPFHILNTSDYVTVFALHKENVILVKQFRPATGKVMIELPSGHVDAGDSPETAAKKELLEETGYIAKSLEFLGTLYPDSGRLGNKLWCYYTNDTEKEPKAKPETGIESFEIPLAKFIAFINDGTFDHALNLALVSLCITKKLITI